MAKKMQDEMSEGNAKNGLGESLRAKGEQAKKLIDEEIRKFSLAPKAQSNPDKLWQTINAGLEKVFSDIGAVAIDSPAASSTPIGEKATEKPKVDLVDLENVQDDAEEDDFSDLKDLDDDDDLNNAPDDLPPDIKESNDDTDDLTDDVASAKQGFWAKVTSLFSRKPAFDDDDDDFDSLSKAETTALKDSKKKSWDDGPEGTDDGEVAVVEPEQEKNAAKDPIELETVKAAAKTSGSGKKASKEQNDDDSLFEVKL
jgi:hypothetical protein